MTKESWPLKSTPRILVTLDNIFGKGTEERLKNRHMKPEDLLPEQDKSQEDRLERVEHEKKKAEDNATDDSSTEDERDRVAKEENWERSRENGAV